MKRMALGGQAKKVNGLKKKKKPSQRPEGRGKGGRQKKVKGWVNGDKGFICDGEHTVRYTDDYKTVPLTPI